MTEPRLLRIYEWPEKCLQIPAVAWLQNLDDPRIQGIFDDMLHTCKKYRGVGLAGPQVGFDMRVVVVMDKIYINPAITGVGSNRESAPEGCLSFMGIEVVVSRFKKIQVQYTDRQGQPQTETMEGLQARAMQHECEHLDGKTFLEHLPKFKRQGFLEKMRKRQRELIDRHNQNVKTGRQVARLTKEQEKAEFKNRATVTPANAGTDVTSVV